MCGMPNSVRVIVTSYFARTVSAPPLAPPAVEPDDPPATAGRAVAARASAVRAKATRRAIPKGVRHAARSLLPSRARPSGEAAERTTAVVGQHVAERRH